MTTRTAKDIVSRALRLIGEETNYIEAPDSAYEDMFDILIDMLDEWRSRGYLIIGNNPESLDDTLSSADPFLALTTNLAVVGAPHFLTSASPDTKAEASKTLQTIRVRTRGLPTMCKPCNMPRGTGNSYWYYFVGPDSDAVCTESGAVITTGDLS